MQSVWPANCHCKWLRATTTARALSSIVGFSMLMPSFLLVLQAKKKTILATKVVVEINAWKAFIWRSKAKTLKFYQHLFSFSTKKAERNTQHCYCAPLLFTKTQVNLFLKKKKRKTDTHNKKKRLVLQSCALVFLGLYVQLCLFEREIFLFSALLKDIEALRRNRKTLVKSIAQNVLAS